MNTDDRPTTDRKIDSVNRCVFITVEEKSCQISSRSGLNRRSLRLSWRRLPQQEQEQEEDDDDDDDDDGNDEYRYVENSSKL